MKTYVALLRGINVSGQKKIKMADLTEALEKLGLFSVTTYIQSGNVIFQSEQNDVQFLSDLISKGIQQRFGFDVPVLVITPETLATIYQKNPFFDRLNKEEIETKKMYFTLLSTPPDEELVKELRSGFNGEEEFVITKNVVYLYVTAGYGKTKLNNNFFEKKLKSVATTRNLKTVIKLLDLSGLNL
ncbi:DUF1697 domain-containing protein [Aquimarina sp. AD10]|uniref:DUF1697 domain-containing protein n=1 Tax=Aquimarina sp. AD10 TaxID=1714849 RepID=UPI000E4C109F|nr:DUF1697 domain-containing protein [Aquimarina sp. AD10]AXT62504.1 DUF1697 domain-containing protein [Aquimarina sp. AD10]RKM90304.1 DUF1697 domain-containing protein [Aquimarina sp. AD10]